jgi:aspartyl-tRNA(Asn)/glutamyl-tRNA(Gln) amidotransferase subunit B
MGEVSKYLNAVEDLSFEDFQETVTPANLAALISKIADQTISNAAGKKIFSEDLVHSPGTMHATAAAYIDAIIESKGLKQMNDTGALEAIVDEVIAANAKNVGEFKAGNEKALNALVGQIMKASKGKANPQQVNDLLRKKLG